MIRRPYVVEGQQIWITGTNEQEIAENYAEAFLSAKGFSPTQDTMRHDLCELIDKWFEYKKDKKEITLRTAKNYDTHVRSIKKHFVGKNVEDVRWTDIQTFFELFKDKAKTTVRHKKVILSQVFQWAVDDSIIKVNPARDSRLCISKIQKKRPAVPFDLYMKICGEIPSLEQPRDRALMALIAFTGMRRGEILALRWEDVNWTSGVISIDKAIAFIGNAPTLKGPKSVAGIRDLPIVEQLYNVLWPIKKPTGVIVSIDGEKNYSDTAYGRAWERISRQINLKDFTAHSFRHSVASIYAASSEVTPKTLQTLLGHADIATTMNVYAKTETRTLLKAGKIFTQNLSFPVTT